MSGFADEGYMRTQYNQAPFQTIKIEHPEGDHYQPQYQAQYQPQVTVQSIKKYDSEIKSFGAPRQHSTRQVDVRLQSNNNTDVKYLQQQLDAKEREIVNLRDTVVSLNNQINDYIKELDQWKLRYTQLQQTGGNQQFVKTTTRINDYTQLDIENNNHNNDWELQRLRDELRLISQERDNLRIKIERNDKFDNNKVTINSKNEQTERELQKLSYEIRQITQEKDDYKRKMEDLQKQLQNSSIEVQNRLNERTEEINRLNVKIEEYVVELAQAQRRFITKDNSSETEGMFRRIQSLQHELFQWKERYRALELEHNQQGEERYRMEINTLQEELNSLQYQIKQSEDQARQQRRENENLKSQVDGYRISFETRQSENDVEKYKKKIMEMDADIQVLIEDLQKRENDYLALEDQFIAIQQKGSETEQLRYTIQELQSKLNNQTQQNQYQTQYVSLQDNYNQLQSDIRIQREQCNKYKNDYERVNNDYMVLKRESETYGFNRDNSRQEVEQLKREISDLQYKLSTKQVDTVSVKIQSEHNKLQTDYEQLQSQYSLLQYSAKSSKQECDELRRQVSDLEYQIKQKQYNDTSSADLSRIRNENANLQERLNSAQSEIRILKEQSNKYRIDYESMNDKYNNYVRESETYKYQIKSSHSETDQLKQRIALLEQQLKQSQRAESTMMEGLETQFIDRLRQEQRGWEMSKNSELDVLRNKLKELELTNQRLRQDVHASQSIKIDTGRIQELEFEARQKQQLIDRMNMELNSKVNEISILQQQLKKQESRVVEVYSNQSDLNRIRDLEEQLRRERDNQQSHKSVVISEQIREKQTIILDLESRLSTYQLEIDRLKNIRQEQENKIQVLIEKVTDYESRLNILQQENNRLEQKVRNRSPDGYIQTKQYTGGTLQKSKQYVSSNENQSQVQKTTTVTDRLVFERPQETTYQTKFETTINQKPGIQSIKNSGFQNTYTSGIAQQLISHEQFVSPDRMQSQVQNRQNTTKSVKQGIMSSNK